MLSVLLWQARVPRERRSVHQGTYMQREHIPVDRVSRSRCDFPSPCLFSVRLAVLTALLLYHSKSAKSAIIVCRMSEDIELGMAEIQRIMQVKISLFQAYAD